MKFEGAVKVDREKIKLFLDIWDKHSNYLSKDLDFLSAIKQSHSGHWHKIRTFYECGGDIYLNSEQAFAVNQVIKVGSINELKRTTSRLFS